MPTVAWLTGRHPWYGGEYYRAYRPALLLAHRMGWHTAVCRGASIPRRRGRPVVLTTWGTESPVSPDVMVIRPVPEWDQDYTDIAHAAGQIVLADLDDDVWSHEQFGAAHPDHSYEAWIAGVDGFLVSTEALAEAVRRHVRCPVWLAPNCYDPYGLGRADPRPGRVIGTRLWISGRQTGDLDLYDQMFLPLLERYDLTWLHIGADEQPTADSLQPSRPLTFPGRGWPEKRCLAEPSYPLPEIWRPLSRLSIGAICMSEAAYNVAKTETHAVELASAGVPLVAVSDHDLYHDVPGRVPLGRAEVVSDRVECLLRPNFWRRESARGRVWATAVARRSEASYLASLKMILRQLASW